MTSQHRSASTKPTPDWKRSFHHCSTMENLRVWDTSGCRSSKSRWLNLQLSSTHSCNYSRTTPMKASLSFHNSNRLSTYSVIVSLKRKYPMGFTLETPRRRIETLSWPTFRLVGVASSQVLSVLVEKELHSQGHRRSYSLTVTGRLRKIVKRKTVNIELVNKTPYRSSTSSLKARLTVVDSSR